ncbi:putative tyrosine-protein kinase [Apostichopus japonicus]|nr:putative tyrosine-protein kinase [Apostichopus japonicus]
MDEVTSRNNAVVWRKDDSAFFNFGSLVLNVPQGRGRISLSDAGIYECYHNTRRNYAVQGLQRIIVRACPADHWGPPDCFGICDNCYNGGVCDDTTGECICPAGFNGSNCLSACDPLGRFGFNCEFQCFEGGEFDYACRDDMFCLPDPFGCRCASGFKGLDCSTDCPQGAFGANCLQTCHCNSGGCNIFTGVCTNNNGRCQRGYSGTNCQIPEQCKQGYYGSQCLFKCHCKNDAACNKITGRCNNNQCAQGFVQQDPNGNCQGIADIQVSKVNPGATAEINCTVESPNFLATVTASLSVTKANQDESFIGDVGNRIELSSKSIVQSYKVSNVMSGDVFSCYLANRDNSRVNRGRHYRRKETDIFVLPLIANSPDFISASNTTIVISWTAWNENTDVGDPPVISYVPYHRTNEEEDWISSDSVQANGMPTLSFTFSDLEPDTLYQFSVAAVREGPFGEGPKSSFESTRTNCTIPSLAPLNVQAAIVEMGSTNVNISWKVPDVQCSTGIKQFLLYFNDLETPNMVEKRYIDANISWYIQKGLESGKNYSFQLTLTTEGGEGPLSEKGEDAVVSVPEGSITEDEDSGEGGSDHQQVGPEQRGDRAQLGEEEEGEVLERGPVGAEEEGEKGKEREREGEERKRKREENASHGPGDVRISHDQGERQRQGQGSGQEKVPKKKSGLAGTEKASQSGSQRNNPPERQVPRAPTSPTRAPSGAHSREPEAGGSLSNQSRSRSGDREPQPSRSPAGIPDRESRGRNPSRNRPDGTAPDHGPDPPDEVPGGDGRQHQTSLPTPPMMDTVGLRGGRGSSHGGRQFPPELTTRVAEIFRKHLGFEDTPEVTTKPTRVSKLTATGETSTRPKSTIPVDASCYDRFEAIADKKRWTAFPAKAERAIRVPDEAWKTLFKCPTIPQEAREKLRSEQGSSSSHIFKNPSQKKLEELLVDVDLAARSGMKFTSVLMLTAEVLMRYHQQLPQDDTYVSRNEAGQLLLLLGPLVRLAFDQFARVAIRSVKARRENVISSIRWPSVEAKERMLALPSLGDDLFAGSFQQKLQEEVSRRETLAKSEFRSSERFRSRPHRLRESRPTRGGRGTSLRTPMRGTPRGRSRGTTSRPPRPWGTRGSGRSPATTRRDGDRSSTRPPFAARP